MSKITVISAKQENNHFMVFVQWVIEDFLKSDLWQRGITLESPKLYVCNPVSLRMHDIQFKIVKHGCLFRIDGGGVFKNGSAHISRNEAEAQSVEAGVIYCEGNFSFESDKSFHFTRTIPKLIDDLRNDKDLEFVIECDLKEFRANKAIMCARSPVFKAMFASNMKEAIENRVRIPDFKAEIVEKMIEFCETDKVKNSKKIETDLYTIAQKYQMNSFIKYSLQLLIDTMSFENACERLLVGLKYSDKEFCTRLYAFIRPNLQHIAATPGFDSMDKEIVIDILKTF
uniref:BTB domain-containing protein n=1 Tax=Panagrolaimus sp. PS1159 TaxID=55785 RepID=A0AC35GTK4_9BILA